ncbi:hypothetical protein BU15DRAFT_80281 [Melanogaster broomeanus]|nr:hypothetical protein BU15DRAFT_80281 [Melanogaster broomeanus]
MASLSADIADLRDLRVSQYVSAVGLVILLWDHLLTFHDEVQLIWQARLSVPKVLFLINRYVVPIVMIVQTQVGSAAQNSQPRCKAWFPIATFVGMSSIAISNFLVLLRLWVLWDRSPRLMLWTLALFILTQTLALGFTAYLIYSVIPTLTFEPTLHICMPTTKPQLVMLWGPGVRDYIFFMLDDEIPMPLQIAFEVMIFVTTFWNAFDRPRTHDVQMAKIMHRDGSVYFFGLFALRLLNMILSVVAPFSLMFLGLLFIWSVSNITLAHLILNLRRVSVAAEGDIADPIELPILHRHDSAHSYELDKFAL